MYYSQIYKKKLLYESIQLFCITVIYVKSMAFDKEFELIDHLYLFTFNLQLKYTNKIHL